VSYPKIMTYLTREWISIKEKIISAWTNKITHFNYATTQRAESMHRVIKKGLPNRRGHLLNVVKYLRIYLFLYNDKLYNYLREERTKKRADLRDPLYAKIHYRISRFIISKVEDHRRFYNLKD
jgi:hypothetical protein